MDQVGAAELITLGLGAAFLWAAAKGGGGRGGSSIQMNTNPTLYAFSRANSDCRARFGEDFNPYHILRNKSTFPDENIYFSQRYREHYKDYEAAQELKFGRKGRKARTYFNEKAKDPVVKAEITMRAARVPAHENVRPYLYG